MEMSQRTPLYLGLITLSSALAAVTVVWAGLIGFGLIALAIEALGRWPFR